MLSGSAYCVMLMGLRHLTFSTAGSNSLSFRSRADVCIWMGRLAPTTGGQGAVLAE